ncbi:MAG TPA: RluA family pseudouridine synthase [Candidatus Sphingobacterium stercoripullorum]|nr:RluA family pseudouridine synthase [Candidatus Sphingobacterium stercoripullorum]
MSAKVGGRRVIELDDQDVVYEDNHLIGINKEAGDLVQGDETGDMPLVEALEHYLKEKYNKPFKAFVGMIHRLDRPVSGLVLFGKTSKAQVRVQKLFKDRKIIKTYIAIVRNPPPKNQDSLKHYLVRNSQKRVTYAYDTEKKSGKVAELDYELIGQLNGYYVLRIKLITGRTHQIRAQLSAIGCPIVGDNKYGYPRGGRKRTICLHGYALEFTHPVRKEQVTMRAPIPRDDFWEKFMPIFNELDASPL